MALVSKSFQDFSLTFEKNAVTDDVLTLRNEAAIKAAVKNIVLYNFFEKPFDPGFGGNVIGLLFENFTPDLLDEIEGTIAQIIEEYEPRVEVIEVDAIFEEDYNDLQVSIDYKILGIPPIIDNLELAFKP
jgi:phage baseplate assembly protein W